MQSVEANVGITIWFAASMIAGSCSNPCSNRASMFSIMTVASSTRIHTDRNREATRTGTPYSLFGDAGKRHAD
jgi:hypothetical protein